ncbi:DNA repair protein rad51c [Cichlidogyrus casuarinus]|uniref:DNA repair protein RAD51 homolog 3 n=1 Tax=Cichlidogyrus casuarinus TaxID=1844966 RepID=A0ABD2PW54_9PLAT
MLASPEFRELATLPLAPKKYSNILLRDQLKFVSLETLLREEGNNIFSLSKQIDNVLGGGFSQGRLTEICGEPGVGKTQLCLQLCASVQIPSWCQGLDGQAVYIDTEGNFIPRRFAQICSALIDHHDKHLQPALERLLDIKNMPEKKKLIPKISLDDMLNRVRYIRVSEPSALVAVTSKLPSVFQKCSPHDKPIKLIVLDSIAMPFRYDVDDFQLRNKLMGLVAKNLLAVAKTYKVAVIITNQITTDFGLGPSALKPALGISWGHVCSIRCMLERDPNSANSRLFRTIKHPARPLMKGSFCITPLGIRDSS